MKELRSPTKILGLCMRMIRVAVASASQNSVFLGNECIMNVNAIGE